MRVCESKRNLEDRRKKRKKKNPCDPLEIDRLNQCRPATTDRALFHFRNGKKKKEKKENMATTLQFSRVWIRRRS